MINQERSTSYTSATEDLIGLRRRVSDLEAQVARREEIEAELRNRNAELELLYRAGQTFVSSLELEDVFAVVLDEVRRTLNAVACSAWLVDRDSQELVCRYVTDPKRELLLGWRLMSGQGVAGWVLSHDRGLIVEDTRQDDRHFKKVDEQTGIESRSLLAVPLRCHGQVFGVIEVIDSLPNQFTPAHLAMAETLAAPAAIAIEMGRLFEQTEALRVFNQSVVQCLEEGILAEDARGIIVFANPKAGQLLEMASDVLVGRRFDAILSLEHRSKIEPELAASLRGEGTSVETCFRAETGRELPVLLTACRLELTTSLHSPIAAAVIGSDKVRPPVTLFAFTDLTRHQQMEEQLRQAEKMETVARLAAGLAHDFNNLLTAINGFSELLLLKLPENDPNRSMIDHILSSGNRAAALVRQLMAFAQRQIVSTQPVDLNQVVRETNQRLLVSLGPFVQMKTELGAEVWPVKADPTQMADVLVGLATNARTAMPEGGKMTVQTANITLEPGTADLPPETTPGDYVMLDVSDTGDPLSDEAQAHIFEPFFLNSVFVADGTGLRMSAVYGAVKQNGGHIRVRSTPGHGTTYSIYLPRLMER